MVWPHRKLTCMLNLREADPTTETVCLGFCRPYSSARLLLSCLPCSSCHTLGWRMPKWRVLGGELPSRSLSFLKMSSCNPLIIWGRLYHWVANSREKIVGTCSLVHFYDINSFLKWKDPVRQVSLITNKWKVQLESMIVDKVFDSSWWWLKDLN